MNSASRSIVVCLFLGMPFLFSSCSSLQKAQALNADGNKQDAMEMAQEYLDDDEEQIVRLEAIHIIGEIGGKAAGEALMPILNDKNIVVRNAAIKTIGKIKYDAAANQLILIAINSDDETFENVAEAIGEIGPPATELLLNKYNTSNSDREKTQYKRVIIQVGPSMIPSVVKKMSSNSFFENRRYFELLIALKSSEAASRLLESIENDQMGEMIVQGLTKIGKRAADPVIAKLKDIANETGQIKLKERLITILGNIKSKKAIDLLEKLTKDGSEGVRNAADFALKKIRGF